MRAPFQVLVIPYRWIAANPEFAVLRRSDSDDWQFIAGGGEDEEGPAEAARREAKEEIGVSAELLPLDSLSTVPANCFAASALWGQDLYVIPEHCFAIDVEGSRIALSLEHKEFQWSSYDEARDLLKWDSNRNALWELNQRLSATLGRS